MDDNYSDNLITVMSFKLNVRVIAATDTNAIQLQAIVNYLWNNVDHYKVIDGTYSSHCIHI